MTGYIIYVFYDIINETMSYNINDIECTIGSLFDKILNVDSNIYDVLFGDHNLSLLDKDIPLCSSSVISVIKASSDTTTPFPITDFTLSRSMPEGIK